ncbi:hypothetical protein FQN57_005438 [Myotisia sp. PD_48]|nr:hypothetical protein FQN57_005438 [Myotisia sp. PD_48]
MESQDWGVDGNEGQPMEGISANPPPAGSISPSKPDIIIDEPPKFDLEAYISNYSGRTRFIRLYFIGRCSTHLSTEALKMAVAEAKSGTDTRFYDKAVQALQRASPSETEAVLDREWIVQTTNKAKAETERLERELKGYKNNLIKESIRMGNEDLGTHYRRIGDLPAASKAFARMRDFCTTSSHISSMLFQNIAISIERDDWIGVQANCYRLRNLPFKPEDELKCKAKAHVALGLTTLANGDYRDAATHFISIEPGLGETFNDTISPNDVAVYGGLCALATMTRSELANLVLDNKQFRNFLELEPHIRRAISFFCASKFRTCLDILDAYTPDYMLDLYLQAHFQKLYTRIRTKAIQQYLLPFSRVTLDSMVKIFSPGQQITTAQGLVDMKSPFIVELIGLIRDGALQARIDVEKAVLVSVKVDSRVKLHATALENMRDYLSDAHEQMLRLNVLYAGLWVPSRGRNGGSAEALVAAHAADVDVERFSGTQGTGKGLASRLGLI